VTLSLPDTPIVRDAAAHVRTLVHPQIYNHSIRTYLLGAEAARRDGVTDLDAEALCVAAIFHDSGTADAYNGPARFEVEGADAAAEFLTARGQDAAVVDAIWQAIALHTTPGIPERRGAIPHYLRTGVLIEFGPPELRESFAEAIVPAEAEYPRNRLEQTLESLVVQQALANPDKAPKLTWAAELVAHHDPDRDGISPGF
jgi:hypothetical protein